MNIIMLTQWFYPEPGPRVHELADELVNRGHRVKVITGFPTYPYDHFYEGYKIKLFSWEEYQGVKVLRLVHFPHGSTSAFKRILHYTSFALSSMFIGNILIGKADCMYVFLPPPMLGLTAACIGLAHNIPFIYDIQDIWPDAGVAMGITDNKWLVFALRILEKVTYPLSTVISVPSAGYRRNLAGKGVDPEKIEVIPNWADEAVYHEMPFDDEFARRYNVRGKFNVTFAGNLGYTQALDTVIAAARRLSNQPDIQFLFVGDGIAKNSLQDKCRDLGLKNILFLGRLPVEEMPRVFSIADILLVHLKANSIFRITIPSKTQAYMASGKPILMAVEGDGAELIESTGSGIICSQEAPEELADSILKAYQLPPGELNAMGKNARKTFLNQFSKKVVVGKFESLLKKVTEIHKNK